jgi:hypothetical protein
VIQNGELSAADDGTAVTSNPNEERSQAKIEIPEEVQPSALVISASETKLSETMATPTVTAPSEFTTITESKTEAAVIPTSLPLLKDCSHPSIHEINQKSPNAEIDKDYIKEQLHEIISEIEKDIKVRPYKLIKYRFFEIEYSS